MVSQKLRINLASLAPRCTDKMNRYPLAGIACEGARGTEGLIIRMRENDQ